MVKRLTVTESYFVFMFLARGFSFKDYIMRIGFVDILFLTIYHICLLRAAVGSIF